MKNTNNNPKAESFANTTINWYPGHMTKAKRMMVEDIKLIDLVIELVDARVPMSSRNPDIDSLAQGKSRVILLNKADLADDRITGQWFDFFSAKGYHVVKIDSRDRGKMKNVKSIIDNACKEKKERDRKRGIINRPVRAMVAGIPNVGKSTFINSFAGKACAQTGNKPGVTKGKQWIRLNKDVELLDTPGILWPKFEDKTVGIRLAFIGSVNDQVINMHELAGELVAYMTKSGGIFVMTKEERLNAEIERTRVMGEFEKEYIMYANVCGIDEAGRGPLCGPVVAGAVILPKECNILYINDSKKLTEKMRDKVYDEIAANAVAWAIGMASPERIDEINILQATYEAMREAIGKLKVTPDILLNDAVTIPGVDIKQVPIIKGDAKSRSIAAASIMAKVTRDRMMEQYDALYPEYGFARHKGYGTKAHIEALKEYGPCPIHRRTFIKNFFK